MNRCHQCNGRFGLIRYRLALKQFCSKKCFSKFKVAAERDVSRLKQWGEFLARRLVGLLPGFFRAPNTYIATSMQMAGRVFCDCGSFDRR